MTATACSSVSSDMDSLMKSENAFPKSFLSTAGASRVSFRAAFELGIGCAAVVLGFVTNRFAFAVLQGFVSGG